MLVNQRILDLAIQAGLIKAYGSDREGLADFDWRLFANLLIEECASRAETYSYMSDNFIALAKELREMKE